MGTKLLCLVVQVVHQARASSQREDGAETSLIKPHQVMHPGIQMC